jgi:hypothetical protein
MPSLVLYTFASIGFVCVAGFAVLLGLVIVDRARQGHRDEPAHKRPRAVGTQVGPNVPAA